MSDMFSQWADRHARIFGLTSPQDAEMFAAWRGAFVSAGFSFQELNAATDWMVKQSAPEFRSEHLKAIQSFIRQRRDEQRRFEERQLPVGKTYCSLCGGTGMVVLPHPRFVRNGEWTLNGSYAPTAAVSCSCEVGQRVEKSQFGKDERKKLLTLDRYETAIPRDLWKQLMDHRHKAAGAQKQAEETTKAADRRGKVQLPATASGDPF